MGTVVNAQALHPVTILCVLCDVNKYQGYHLNFTAVLQHFQQVFILMEVETCDLINNIGAICPFVFGVKNFGGIMVQPILPRSLSSE